MLTRSLIRTLTRPSIVSTRFTHCIVQQPIPKKLQQQQQPVRQFHQTRIVKMADSATASYRFNHTMIRIKDPEKSIEFYTKVLGMDVIDEHDAGDFKLFFLAYNLPGQKGLPRGEREGILELTWNKGTEKDPNFKYHNGNDEPQGFGHTCISVDNLEKACARFDSMGVKFKKRPEDGKMKSIAFIYDPDMYWIEIIAHNKPQ